MYNKKQRRYIQRLRECDASTVLLFCNQRNLWDMFFRLLFFCCTCITSAQHPHSTCIYAYNRVCYNEYVQNRVQPKRLDIFTQSRTWLFQARLFLFWAISNLGGFADVRNTSALTQWYRDKKSNTQKDVLIAYYKLNFFTCLLNFLSYTAPGTSLSLS